MDGKNEFTGPCLVASGDPETEQVAQDVASGSIDAAVEEARIQGQVAWLQKLARRTAEICTPYLKRTTKDPLEAMYMVERTALRLLKTKRSGLTVEMVHALFQYHELIRAEGFMPPTQEPKSA